MIDGDREEILPSTTVSVVGKAKFKIRFGNYQRYRVLVSSRLRGKYDLVMFLYFHCTPCFPSRTEALSVVHLKWGKSALRDRVSVATSCGI